jgi:amidase
MRGSLLGVGNDNCGGLRLPALCCGLVGFKPSSRRIPSSGQKLAGRWGNFGIISSAGTISHSVRDARYFMQNILQFDCWSVDEDVLSVPWRATFESVPKRFGVIFEDPEYPLHPYVFRNLQDALMRITAAGHQVIPMDNILPHDIISTTAFTAMTVLNMDPEKTPLGFVARGGEPLVPSISAATMPGLANMKPNINGVFNLNNDISRIRSIFREAIVQNNLDAIIMPGYQATAVAHDLMEVPAYAVLANLLDVCFRNLPEYSYADKDSTLPVYFHMGKR